MNDIPIRLAIGGSVLVLSLAVRAASTNRLVRRKLRLSLLLVAVNIAVNLFLWNVPVGADLRTRIISINQLLLALSAINLIVVTLINPLRADRIPERFPNIVQDTIIIGLFLLVSTFVMQEKFLTTSAVGAVVVGFALQDTLGNMFSGLAIQVEKPFRVGHWVTVGPYEGIVTEVTWRATKMRTKSGNQVILPNSFISKEAIVNYSEPDVPTRLDIEVGVAYGVPPDRVKACIREGLRELPLVLRDPPPEILVQDFGASAIIYLVRFWIDDFAADTRARDQVRSAIYYALRRYGYEIPWPIQIEYQREEVPERPGDRIARIDGVLRHVDLFAPLSDQQRYDLAAHAAEQIYGSGHLIVRQHDEGRSMFVVASGRVRVVESSGVVLATIGRHGYFGEMSMLTGQPRSASVFAETECELIELTADALRELALVNADVLATISDVVAARRADLERQRDEAAAARGKAPETSRSLLSRIQAFLGL